MTALPVILIFDVGKTNKKILLFDDQYHVVFEDAVQLSEKKDEDGFPCEDVLNLTEWIKMSLDKIRSDKRYDIRAINFSGYGASFVYVDKDLKPLLPLYNYLKPYPKNLQDKFYSAYGGEHDFSRETSSPVLGNLNSGMQLYQLKAERPDAFEKIKYALHLPQYLSAIISKQANAEITSIGCHTNLWNFNDHEYHRWVTQEGLIEKFPSVKSSDACINVSTGDGKNQCVGIGLHDSSSALIPYLINFQEPFILLSTGTWCISLNPFNHTPLTSEELQSDCLCYLTYEGTPVKASRLFAGHDHDLQVDRLATHFNTPTSFFTTLQYDSFKMGKTKEKIEAIAVDEKQNQTKTPFSQRDLHTLPSAEEGYVELIADLVLRQLESTRLVQNGDSVKRIFVDGGFSKNSIYMHFITAAFAGVQVYAASVAQASALGAALVLHPHWNKKSLPSDLIELKLYSV